MTGSSTNKPRTTRTWQMVAERDPTRHQAFTSGIGSLLAIAALALLFYALFA